jgi:fructokinase
MLSVIGEALIDLVQSADAAAGTAAGGPPSYLAHPGGSPYNVAIGLARLGHPALLQARLSGDTFGRQLRAHAAANGVDLSIAIAATEPTTLAIVGLDSAGNATYDFYLNGTADWQWTTSELGLTPAGTTWVHAGSLASWTEPGASIIGEHLGQLREAGTTVISYDPNVRPLLMPDHDAGVEAIEAMVRLAHVVKASSEDLEWMYPDRFIGDVLEHWRSMGPDLVVVTDGSRGAHALTRDGEALTVAARSVAVVDTVGAGDAFMAGLIGALSRLNLQQDGLAAEQAQLVLSEAMLVAALTVQKAGANPPTAAELAAARSAAV